MKLKMILAAVAGVTSAILQAAEPTPGQAVLRLGSPFTDGAVLQRDRPIRVWGWADPGASVEVSFGGASATATAQSDGRWRTELPAFPASKEPRVLTAVMGSGPAVEVRDILVGEVWLAAGQSNMEFPLWHRGVRLRDRQGALTAQMTNKPHVRYAKMCDYAFSVAPVRERRVVWKSFTPDNLANDYVPAVGVYFAIELANALDIPIGWIACDWGGTRIEPWIPAEGYAAVPELADFAARKVVQKFRTTDRAYSGGRENQQPTVLWNRQVACLTPFQVRGMIWYQGESNRDAPQRYRALLDGLHAGWSGCFENPGFRLYLVQIAPHNYVDDVGQLSLIQEAQQAFADANPNAEIAIINDVGDLGEIHPQEKHTVGKRLAAFALANDYGWTQVRPRAPTLMSASVEGARMTLQFRDADGLYTYDEALGFELAGADGVWREAKAVGPTGRRGYVFPEGRIVLEAQGVESPRHVRYLAKHPWTGHVFSGSTIPLGTFHYDLPGTATDFDREVSDLYYVGDGGDDANLGTDPFRPMHTLDASVARIRALRRSGKIPAGKSVGVKVLSEVLVLDHPLVLTPEDSHLRFSGGERPGMVVLRGAPATPDGERPSRAPCASLVEVSGARDITFEGMQFEFAAESAVCLSDVTGFKFGNCEFNRLVGDALRLTKASKGSVVHCVFEEIGRSAVRFAACTNVTVDNCVSRRTARIDEMASAFVLTDSVCTLTHNLVYETAKGAAVFDAERGVLPETEPGLYDDHRYWGSGVNFWLKIFNPPQKTASDL